MSDHTDKKPEKQKEREAKEARVAEALRANLRRRKAATRKSKPSA